MVCHSMRFLYINRAVMRDVWIHPKVLLLNCSQLPNQTQQASLVNTLKFVERSTMPGLETIICTIGERMVSLCLTRQSFRQQF
jgi:hypothetical protein